MKSLSENTMFVIRMGLSLFVWTLLIAIVHDYWHPLTSETALALVVGGWGMFLITMLLFVASLVYERFSTVVE